MSDSGIDRREFLRRGALAGASVGLLPLAAGAALAADERRACGASARSDARGCASRTSASARAASTATSLLVQHALERGINYFDTAESYQDGRSEETIGRALLGSRERVILASKVGTDPDTSRAALMESLDASLRRLRTDRIDVYFNHAVNDVARLKNPEWYEFVSRAKAAGKLRFTGMSGHGGRLVECLDYALDQSLVDVILVGFNFGQDPAFFQRFTKSLDFVAVQPDLPRVLAQGAGEGRGRGRDEDAARREAQRHAPLRDRRRDASRRPPSAGSSRPASSTRWSSA